MKWMFKDPSYGDMVRVKLGDIYHYGIFVSDTEVIQFGPPPTNRFNLRNDEIEVISTDIDAFLVGGFLEVAEFDKKEKKKNRNSENTVKYARENLGRKGYNILYNNCEHFATECVSGAASCSQVDDVRALFRNFPIVDVFTARISESCKIHSVIPAQRDEEIKSVNNEKVKREKYCAWKLLEYAFERSLGLKIKNMSFSKEPSGKWTSPSCYFSISHCNSIVAVAVSRAPVGIDVESYDAPLRKGFEEKALTDKELAEYATIPDERKNEYLISKWSAKEAFFKRSEKASFAPAETLISENELVSRIIEEKIICSVVTATPEKVRFYDNIPENKYLN